MAIGVQVWSSTNVFTLLALLSMTVTPGAFGRPTEEDIKVLPELHIASSISIDRPIFDEKLGPISAGQNLVLTCFSKDLDTGTLSWWENDSELESIDASDGKLGARNLVLKDLSVGDTGRRLTCRENKLEATKSVVLEIVEPLLILRNAEEIVQEDFIEVLSKQKVTLICILQGYSPAVVSWWEGETELVAEAIRTQYSSSSILTLESATLVQMERHITCRSQGKEIPRNVEVRGLLTQTDIQPPTGSWIKVATFIVTCVVFLTAIVTVTVLIKMFWLKKCAEKSDQNARYEGECCITEKQNKSSFDNKLCSNNYEKLTDSEAEPEEDSMPEDEASLDATGNNELIGVFVKSDGTTSSERCIHSQKFY